MNEPVYNMLTVIGKKEEVLFFQGFHCWRKWGY